MSVDARTSDSELLRQYIGGSEEAFAEVVRRHIDWVYSAALRRVGQHELAEDIAQSVFIVLAREAGKLRRNTLLGPWMFGVLRHATSNALRAERRRKSHEQSAALKHQMRMETNDTWSRIAPDLEEAVGRLREVDRRAIILRFYEQKDFDEVAAAMGLTELAARKRVQRAVEKLRELCGALGNTETFATLLQDQLGQQSVARELVQSTTRIAMAAANGGASLNGATMLADAVIRGIAMKQVIWGAVTLAAILLISIFSWLPVELWHGQHQVVAMSGQGNAIVAVENVAVSQPTTRPIKVGVLVSQYTATGPCWTNNRKQFGFMRARQGLELLKDPGIDLYAVVDPGTDLHGEIIGAIRGMPADHIIDGGDAAELRKMDVIVSYFQWNLPDAVLGAMVQAVRDGTGLLVQGGAGIYRPGFTSDVQKLVGISDGFEVYDMTATPCTSLPHSPIPDLDAFAEQPLIIPTITGVAGHINGKPLMQAKALNDDLIVIQWEGHSKLPTTQIVASPSTQAATQPTVMFYPLYISQLGKGRIVVCQWESMPQEWRDATKGRFHVHAVQWLAGRPIQ